MYVYTSSWDPAQNPHGFSHVDEPDAKKLLFTSFSTFSHCFYQEMLLFTSFSNYFNDFDKKKLYNACVWEELCNFDLKKLNFNKLIMTFKIS